jgi:hypothetical protein
LKKLIILGAILAAAGYVVTHYFGLAGPTMTSNAGIANEVLNQR